MFGIGTGEIILILIIAALVVGPEKMVEFAGQLGRFIAQFTRETESVTKEFREALSLEPGDEEGQSQEQEATPALEDGEQPVGEPSAEVVEEEGSPEVAGEVEEGASVAAQEEEKEEPSVPIFVDSETDSTFGEENGAIVAPPAEAVSIEVAELVPEDEEVEPVTLEEPILVVDEGNGGEPEVESALEEAGE